MQTIRVNLAGTGVVTDYPFDHYTTGLALGATVGGHEVPLSVSLREVDPFFLTKVRSTAGIPDVVVDQIRISRSRGTLILAWFMMIATRAGRIGPSVEFLTWRSTGGSCCLGPAFFTP